MTIPCRYDQLAALVAHFDGVTAEEPSPSCTDRAVFSTVVARGDHAAGFDVEIHTALCRGHEQLVQITANGYVRSSLLGDRSP